MSKAYKTWFQGVMGHGSFWITGEIKSSLCIIVYNAGFLALLPDLNYLVSFRRYPRFNIICQKPRTRAMSKNESNKWVLFVLSPKSNNNGPKIWKKKKESRYLDLSIFSMWIIVFKIFMLESTIVTQSSFVRLRCKSRKEL